MMSAGVAKQRSDPYIIFKVIKSFVVCCIVSGEAVSTSIAIQQGQKVKVFLGPASQIGG